jgi:hypothetical protein
VPTLIPVPAADIEANWHVAEPWIADAIQRQAIRDTAETFRGLCADGSAQLWLVIDGGVAGAILTEIYDTTKGKTCAVPVVASVSFEHIEPLFEFIEAWARAEGCVRMEGFGRFGWVRALKQFGWRPLAAVIEKDI